MANKEGKFLNSSVCWQKMPMKQEKCFSGLPKGKWKQRMVWMQSMQ